MFGREKMSLVISPCQNDVMLPPQLLGRRISNPFHSDTIMTIRSWPYIVSRLIASVPFFPFVIVRHLYYMYITQEVGPSSETTETSIKALVPHRNVRVYLLPVE